MKPHELDALERDPDGAEGFMGEQPQLLGHAAIIFELYWILRQSTPADQPIDMPRALELWDRLYGEGDAFRLVEELRTMDHAYAVDRNAQDSKSADEIGVGESVKGRRGRASTPPPRAIGERR